MPTTQALQVAEEACTEQLHSSAAVSGLKSRVLLADLDFSKDYVHINGIELFAQQLGIPAKLAKLGTVQVINRHPDCKAGKGGEDLA